MADKKWWKEIKSFSSNNADEEMPEGLYNQKTPKSSNEKLGIRPYVIPIIAITVIVLALVVIILSIGSPGDSLNESSEEEGGWVLTNATIMGSEGIEWIQVEANIENNSGWYEDWEERNYQECYNDEYGDRYCDYVYYDWYDCYADLNLSWTVDGIIYRDWVYTPSVSGEFLCLEMMEDYYRVNDKVIIEVNPIDSTDFQVFTLSHGATNGTIWKEITYLEYNNYGIYSTYECQSIIRHTYTFEGIDYNGSFNEVFFTGTNSCMGENKAQNAPSKQITIYVNSDNPSESQKDKPTEMSLSEILGSALCFILPIVLLVLSGFGIRGRFGSTSYSNDDGHYNDNQRWYSNMRIGMMGRRSSGRRAGSRGRSSARGRSGGGRSGGGRSGGGRSGGGRSGGGRGRR